MLHMYDADFSKICDLPLSTVVHTPIMLQRNVIGLQTLVTACVAAIQT